MVPRFRTASSSVIPTPSSSMQSVFAAASTVIRTADASCAVARRSDRVSDKKRTLSMASAALDTSSRRNTSRSEYTEWIIS